MQETILVTGGAGYIGSHTLVALLDAGYRALVVDNLCNSRVEALARVSELTGQEITFINGDVRDTALLTRILVDHSVDAAIHFAGLKAVGESVAEPLAYYDNNVAGSVSLCRAMAEAGVRRLVFSSSATVYGTPDAVPIREDAPAESATNPYGRSKLFVEQILRDLWTSDPRWEIALLRYFNPVGAHPSGRIGEDPAGIPNNLMPYICQVATGRREYLRVFGDDYPTVDGTGVRDYIHVVDLAEGHVKALDALAGRGPTPLPEGVVTVNLGTGHGYSVLQVVEAFERASGRPLPHRIVERRPGDIAECYADPAAAARLLGWQARFDLERMCTDAWRWQERNPQGYAETGKPGAD